MSAPNPQYDAIVSVLADRNVNSDLHHYRLGPETQYFVGDKKVICLGVYGALMVAIFGEWQGSVNQKPAISPEDIRACATSFLVRSATQEETVIYGGSKVVVCLRVAAVESSKSPSPYTAKIIFRPPHSGFYNPVV